MEAPTRPLALQHEQWAVAAALAVVDYVFELLAFLAGATFLLGEPWL